MKRVDALMTDAVLRGDIPGAVVVVGRKGRVVYRRAFGASQLVPKKLPMSEDLMFDMASLTKPLATATSILILVEQGRISLSEEVRDFVPGFGPPPDAEGQPPEEPVRIWHLLTHTSGLPAYLPPTEGEGGPLAGDIESLIGGSATTSRLAVLIAGLPRTDPPGRVFRYSCLGYITLAHILQHVTGRSLDEFAAENVFKPLGMKHTMFAPPPNLRDKCVPTQLLGGEPLRGIVHDPLARLQGGVSGNAGLFSTANDLAVFCQMMLDKGTHNGRRILSPLSVERMTEVFPGASFAGRGLGWDLDSGYASCGGDLFGPKSYGHTGYTGTSVWIDPETRMFLIFLTNRVHPDDQGSIAVLRSRLANVVAASMVGK
ncbi:MAG: beta-lactamase family protein [Candidatus Aminicenantes bacterium]|nr:beta-lactamase family protein [Candidatus Aminicenantes bacterium]